MMTLKELIAYYENKSRVSYIGPEAAAFRHTAELLRELRRLRYQIAKLTNQEPYNKYNHMDEPEDE